jgi:hypothetical protein
MAKPERTKKGRRAAWDRPTVTRVGTVGTLLQGGGGKLSIVADDTGDAPRKPKGQEK